MPIDNIHNTSNKIKIFCQANLFLFLPVLFILILTPIIHLLIGSMFTDFLKTYNPSCNYSFGGGSKNLCENMAFTALGIIVLISTIISFFLSDFIIHLLHIKWKSSLYGIALFYGIPITFLYIYETFTNGIYGNSRHVIDNFISTITIPLIILGLVCLSYKSYRAYIKKLDLR